MKKKLDVRDLEMGMYISELDRPWVESPFLFQGFELSSKEELSQLRFYLRVATISTPWTISSSSDSVVFGEDKTLRQYPHLCNHFSAFVGVAGGEGNLHLLF